LWLERAEAAKNGRVAIWFLLIFGMFVPYIGFKSGRRLRAGALISPRKYILINVLIMEGFFRVISLLTAQNEGIQLSPPGRLSAKAVVFAICMAVVCLAVLTQIWRRSSEEE
jgi:hypothetical protein